MTTYRWRYDQMYIVVDTIWDSIKQAYFLLEFYSDLANISGSGGGRSLLSWWDLLDNLEGFHVSSLHIAIREYLVIYLTPHRGGRGREEPWGQILMKNFIVECFGVNKC